MFAGKAIRCDCGYQVRASDEETLVEEIRLHASEAHDIAFSIELARKLARGGRRRPATPKERGLGRAGVSPGPASPRIERRRFVMKLRPRAPSPAFVISLIALFVALGGTAYASGLISGKQIIDHSIPAKKLTAAAVNALQERSFNLGPFTPDSVVHQLTTTHGIDVNYKCDSKQIHLIVNKREGGESMFVSGDYAEDGVMKSLNEVEIQDFSGQTVNVNVIAFPYGDRKVTRIDLGGMRRAARPGEGCWIWGLITTGTRPDGIIGKATQ